MQNKRSKSRFYVSNIIFYTCLLTSPLSATLEHVVNKQKRTESFQINVTERKEQEEEKNQEEKWLIAVKEGNLEKLKNLHKTSEIHKIKDKNGYNVLHYACFFSDSIEMVTWLLDECKIPIESKAQYQVTPFLFTAVKGQLEIAKMLKQRGANINAKDKDGKNALHKACVWSGSEAMVAWLLDECKIPIESKAQYQVTPFLLAAVRGQLEIAKMLKQRGANINAKDKDGKNALHAACLWSGSEAMVTWLLDECKIPIESKAQYQETPFLFAAVRGQLEIAKMLKQRGANINAKDKNRNIALHYTCLYSDNVNMVTWLLDICKISIEAKGQYKRTPFLFASAKGQLKVAKVLKERGANIYATDFNEDNALHFACLFSGSEAMVKWLLDVCKISIETKGKQQKTPFLFASAIGQLKLAKLLRQQGANINAKDEDRNNALHLACLHSGSETMVKWLLDVCKIGIETKGQYQNTPFLCAAKKGRLEIANLLKQKGANIHAKEKEGDNALHLTCFFSSSVPMAIWLLNACKMPIEAKGCAQNTPFLCAAATGRLQTAKLLKQKGANINAKNNYENNALHFACLYSGSLPMVKWLLEACKIPIEEKGYAENTPFLCAVQEGQFEIAKLLQARGANINARDKDGKSVLDLADSGSVEMKEWLINVLGLDRAKLLNWLFVP